MLLMSSGYGAGYGYGHGYGHGYGGPWFCGQHEGLLCLSLSAAQRALKEAAK